MSKKAVLFLEEGKDLRITYPELADVSEFKKLSSNEMRFIFLYACDSSPYHKMQPKDRILKCLEVLRKSLTSAQLLNYSKLEFPDNIKAALDRMFRFDLGVRMAAREIVDKFFAQIKSIADMDLSGEADIEKRKKHIDLIAVSTRILPNIVAQLENGFGIRYVEEEPDEPVTTKRVTWEEVRGKQ